MKGSDHSRARNRLRLGIALFVLALAVPSLLLVHKAYDQMKWESFRQQQLIAEELADRVNEALVAIARTEDARPIEDYAFLVRSGDAAASYTRRSPLAELPSGDRIPGLIGWFEVAADGAFSSPLVPEAGISPADYGVDAAELALRQARAQQIRGVLVGNRLVERDARERRPGLAGSAALAPEPAGTPRSLPELGGLGDTELAEAPAPQETEEVAPPQAEPEDASRLSQAAFERLARKEAAPAPKSEMASRAKGIDALQLDEGLALRSQNAALEDKSIRDDTDRAIRSTPEAPVAKPLDTQAKDAERRRPVQLFESTVEPFEVGLLDSGHLLLFRTVWRQGARLIQGALIEQKPFLDALIGRPLATTVLAHTTHLIVAYRSEILASFRARPNRRYDLSSTPLDEGRSPMTGALLYRTRMQEPFGGLELIFSVSQLPTPPGAAVIGWMAGALALVLVAGGWLMYRLGLGQLALVRQQQDFVSAVSHELKTPLTSIRMYAEMLRAGFATEARKETYYRFIHEESERLSRLIANVLQLARIGRDALVLEPRPMGIGALMAKVRERVTTQVERAGFVLETGCDLDAEILVDPDAFAQILINLVDNALKFSAKAQTRRIEIRCELLGASQLRVGVRDFGPGIPKEQRKRIFDLFYRGSAAKAQAISGTGIGLALVQRLSQAMGGRVTVVDRSPGVEICVDMPLTRAP
ncbi:sensor histidine kinase [Thiorhodococcus minor]|uniref:histidine kinase n=1 Tax=Thiorhodococcus minor TaxID=57489 RepID=A0A6M0JUT3_9GAMM|nr:HAMP domain-containing sensor histidine kinase [Thiorhodococcus minor]NEV60681.1 sensor histidine kinase [Thiorhodococcus minor]